MAFNRWKVPTSSNPGSKWTSALSVERHPSPLECDQEVTV